MPEIYLDADGCPVKDETYRVAQRYGLTVYVVASRALGVPSDPRIHAIAAGGRFDAADDWIAERVGEDDIAVTADIPLAARCLEKGARVLSPRGQDFTEETIGDALASRALMDQLRQMGMASGGPPPMGKADRSRYLSRLDEVIQAIRRAQRG
ncbi:MAG: YaiI/YqxD family protein [Deferrisomatales bacterium]|nr:YaiI/YqxD family protein [Deferrisomatales bacterium]